MATADDIEVLRRFAYEEELTAAIEGRDVDGDTLTSISRLVLPDFVPVLCESDAAYSLTFDSSKDKFNLDAVYDTSIGGRFGGLLICAVDGVDADLHKTKFIGYYVLDSKHNNDGYIFPVATSVIEDVAEVAKEDIIYQELVRVTSSEKVSIDKLLQVVGLMLRDNPNLKYYNAHLRSVLQPIDLFSYFASSRRLTLNKDQDVYGDIEDRVRVGTEITKADTFGIVSTDDMQPELVIIKGGGPAILLPLGYMIEYIAADQLDQSKLPYDADLRNRIC